MNIRIISLFMMVISISGFLLSYFIIGSFELSSAFIGWMMVSTVLYLITTSRRSFSNPESLVNSYRYMVRQVVEEFGLQDVDPYFIPSSSDSSPVLYLSPDVTSNSPDIPKRLVIVEKSVGIRLETLGTYVLNELGGVSEGLSSAESILKSVLTTYLEMAKDVEIIESYGENILIRVKDFIREFVGDDPLSVNIYSQIIGPIIAEALDKVIKLSSVEEVGKDLLLRFQTLVSS